MIDHILRVKSQLLADQSHLPVGLPHICEPDFCHFLIISPGLGSICTDLCAPLCTDLCTLHSRKIPDQIQLLLTQGRLNTDVPAPLIQLYGLHIIGPQIVEQAAQQGEEKGRPESCRHDGKARRPVLSQIAF